MPLGEKIREVRKAKGISQLQLARKAGVAQSAISYIESTAQTPNTETLAMIARALEVSLSYLLEEQAENENSNPLPPQIDVLVKVAYLLPVEKLDVLVETAKAML